MTDRELLQMALDALEDVADDAEESHKTVSAIEAIRARLAQPEPEPVAWMWDVYSGAGYTSRGIDFYPTNIPFAKHTPLYTAPPQREWQGLTDEEILEEYRQSYGDDGNLTDVYFAQAIEAKLKEKNTT